MNKRPFFVLMVPAVLLWPALCATAQSDAEKARIDTLIADSATVGAKVRAYDGLHQKLADVFAKRAAALEKEGKKEEAEQQVQRANAELMLARQAYERALQRYPGNAELHNYYGEILFDRFEEREKGVGEWRKAVERDDKLSSAYNNLGIYLCHNGEYVEGLQNLDKAVLLEPENPDYQYNLAQIYLTNWPQVMKIRKWTAEQVYKAAMTASETAARCAPRDFDLVVDYARNFFVAEQMDVTPDWEAAAVAWQSARTLARSEEEVFNTWLNEGRVWYRAGNGGKSEKCCEEALKIRPQSLVAKELRMMAREPKSFNTAK
jgi:Tfp pilus assembly protein PilF